MATETARMEFLLERGDPEAARPVDERPGIAPDEPKPYRGLTIRRLTLNKNYDGRIQRWFGGQNEIYFLASSIMFGDKEPFVFPAVVEGGDQAIMKLKRGESFEFDLGAGAPLFPERELMSGPAVAVWVMESDNDRRKAGEKMKAAAEAVKSDKTIVDALQQAITNPGAFTAQQVLGAIGEVVKVIGTVLSKDGDEQVGLFSAYFPRTGSWDDMLVSRKEGATVELREIKEER